MSLRKWLIAALAACGWASGCSQYNTNLSIQTSSSTLTFVSPQTATAGSGGFTITANGAGFTSGSFILWNGSQLTTTFVNSTQLTAPVPATDLSTAGSVQIAVQVPGSATSPTQNVNNTTTTEVSNIVLFTINSAPGTPPAISSVSASTTSQASTPYCSPQGLTLTVNGTNFTSDALVSWNGSPRSTTYVSATQLTASITAVDTAFPGAATVTVTNSVGNSNSRPFTMTTPATALPAPTLTSVTPNSAPAGSPAFTLLPLDPATGLPKNALVITDSQGSFLPCTVLQWVDSNNAVTTLPTEYIPAAAATATTPAHPLQLDAAVPATKLAGASTAQTACVVAFNITPPSGINVTNCSQSSQAQIFTINPPSITAISSSTTSSNNTPSCSASDLTLTVTGTNFVNGSAVDWIIPGTPAITKPLTTSFVSSTQLTATVPATYVASPGTVNIGVSNLGAASSTAPFTISASSPPATMNPLLSPASATAGTAALTLTVTGQNNILPCSVVQWVTSNPATTTPLATTYVKPSAFSAPQLTAIVPAGFIAAVGTAQVQVANLSSVSAPVAFSIVGPTITSISPTSTPSCATSNLTLTVNGTNFVNELTVNWNGSPRATTFVSATQLTAALTMADTAFLATGVVAPHITVSSQTVTSNSAQFSTTTPTPAPIIPPATSPAAPAISSLLPKNAAEDSGTGRSVLLSLTGSNLFPCSTVLWNGTAASNGLPATVYVGPSGITSLIPGADLAAVGANTVSVSNPTSLGGLSGSSQFSVFSSASAPVNPVGIAGALSLPLMSADQRYGVYVLASTDGTNEALGTPQNIFVADTCQGAPSGCTPANTLVSAGMSGNADGDSVSPSVSTDGRYVAFLSSATNLVSNDTNGVMDAFVRDTCTGAPSGCAPSTQRVSVATDGTQANAASTSATVSADGRYVTFLSGATNLAAGSPSSGGVFVRDTCAGAPSGCTPSTQLLSSQ